MCLIRRIRGMFCVSRHAWTVNEGSRLSLWYGEQGCVCTLLFFLVRGRCQLMQAGREGQGHQEPLRTSHTARRGKGKVDPALIVPLPASPEAP